VTAPNHPSGPNNNPPNHGPQVNYGNDGTVQLPSEIDTGQGGTADGNHSIMDPVWLLPLTGLVLIAVAVGLRLRQTTSRRRP
jgi:hypothetical protein